MVTARVGKQSLTTEDAEQWVRELGDAIAHAAPEVVFADPRVETPLARGRGAALPDALPVGRGA